MTEDWLLVTIKAPLISQEALSYALFEAGAHSLWEDLPDGAGRIVLKSSFPPTEALRLMAEIPGYLLRISESFNFEPQEFSLTLSLLPFLDYEEAFKKELTPIWVGQDLVILPSGWSEPINPPDDRIFYPLQLDPGAAFGSGRHPTTFLCLKLLVELKNFQFNRVLDVGSGSGILSLAASLLLPQTSEILGIDNDPDTLEVAEANLKKNNLSSRVKFSSANLGSLPAGAYSLILANLTLNSLVKLAPHITERGSDNATLIISGLNPEQVPEAAEAFTALGWVWEKHLGLAEWSALLLKHVSPSSLGPTQANTQTPPPREMVPEPSREISPLKREF
ncbi:MAG: 50S ribosomal protein L11 methyltransferase [Deltaproteobacteria bacterium]|jgi:ribosomal protein L11 methyltransferase|nr:50S ribosomal protein L11 methyltransferase [Deltaproteobacteria bacterium]